MDLGGSQHPGLEQRMKFEGICGDVADVIFSPVI